MAIAMDAIAMKRLIIKTTSEKSATTNEDASKPHSLALFSSIAVMMSDDQPEEIQQEHQKKRKKSSVATVPSIQTVDSVCEHERPKKLGQLTRSLSRSLLSTGNLQQMMAACSSPLTLVHKQREQQQQESQQWFREKRRRMGSPLSISRSLLPLALAVPLVTISSKSLPMTSQNEELLLITASTKGMEQITGASGTRKTAVATTDDVPITTPIAHCPSDEIASNVYRSYEIQLPDCCDIGPILSNKTSSSNGNSSGNSNINSIGNGNGNSKIVDDYNYEVSTCTPLLDPPRFPSTMESFVIAKRSREEKNNWGWYA